jgi:hypothetical protein
MKHALFILLLFQYISAQDNTMSLSEGLDPVLIITAKGNIFDQARNGLVNELRDDFSISAIEVDEKKSLVDIDLVFNYDKPKAVVLIGNNAIRLYRKYSFKYKDKTASVQTISILALDIKRAVSGIPNVNAIAYETPMVSALVSFRRVISIPLTRVGVLYREPLEEFLEEHTRFCSRENIEIKGMKIGNDPSTHQKEIADALRRLFKREKVDALWIANDDVLLKPDLLGNVWLPALEKKKIPCIVGVESLVSPELNFGTFAVIPDPVALGEQAAEIAFDLKLDNWEHVGVSIHSAFSTYSVLNLKKAKEITKKENLRTYEVSKVLK